MSRMSVYAVLDVKANAFVSPHFHKSHGQAIRDFSAAVRGGKSMLSNYPDDFSLYHLGYFDEVSGLLEDVTPPVFLSRASEHVSLNPASAALNPAPAALEVPSNGKGN